MVTDAFRVAAIQLTALPVERAFGEAGPKSPPRAVRRTLRGRWVLVAVSSSARAKGVAPGMTLVEARARVPELEVREDDPSGDRRLLDAAAEALLVFGPAIEVVPPAGLLVEIGKSAQVLEHLGLRDEAEVAARIVSLLAEFGHRAAVAIADDVDTARTLVGAIPSDHRKHATTGLPVRIAAPGASAAALAGLPLDALLWTDPVEDPEERLLARLGTARGSLRVLGVHDVGHLASFPEDQVASRFGDAGALLMERARGKRSRPLRVFTPSERVIESFDLEAAIEGLEPVLFILKRLLDRLEVRLGARGRAVTALELSFIVEPSRKRERLRVSPVRPTRSARTLLSLAREAVDGRLSGAVRAMAIEALAPVPDLGAQLDLFTAHAQRIETVEGLISRLQAALGEDAVFSAEIQDSHRPEAAWAARPFEIERALAEPRILPPKREPPVLRGDVLTRATAHEDYALPPADAQLSVTLLAPSVPRGAPSVPRGAPSVLSGAPSVPRGAPSVPSGAPSVPSGAPSVPERKPPRRWPKTVERRFDDEPAPRLAPRPMMLLPEPEPARLETDEPVQASLQEPGRGPPPVLVPAAPPPVLHWRGQRLTVEDLGPPERFECEWWRPAPLERDYLVAEVDGGRCLWIYAAKDRALWVHGVFD